MSEPAGVYEAMQLAEASARGPFWKELQEALARCSSLTASLEASDRREQRYREALHEVFLITEDCTQYREEDEQLAAINDIARALLVEHNEEEGTSDECTV